MHDVIHHAFHIRATLLHEEVDIFGDSSGEGVKRQKIFIRIVRLVVMKNILQYGSRERTQLDDAVTASVKRFAGIHKNLVHQRIDRTAGHEVDKRGVFVAIPYILHLAVNRRIDIEELLELIDDQVIPFRLSGTHQHLEDICKGIDGFRNEDIR